MEKEKISQIWNSFATKERNLQYTKRTERNEMLKFEVRSSLAMMNRNKVASLDWIVMINRITVQK